ncbi:phosphatidylglycerol lysyltransferase domain-containing protein [Pseudoruegeria sp. HB172150]|uniref:phosphatidylglycerol lysyltransferase domain-containing protein n=1 Tax=Pseudoruegeria sp. HB172150 TaxID=2721164 RepID=UPI0015552A32|nr:phosphatidylglycerol lysyltransferase domain-containing protein [Pseudoruegeria sp. HB172150]
MDMRWQHLRQHGDFPLAYPVITESYLNTFGDRRGMITYAQKMGHTFVLGDPVAAPEDAPALISEFIEAFGTPVFVACRQHTALTLSRFGYRINQVGHDAVIDLATHSFAGGTYKRVRYSTNWLNGKGMTVTEQPDRAVSARRLRKLSRQWQQTKITTREIRFLNREFTVDPEPEVRRFFALSEDGMPIGIINFDPVYSGGKTIGYLASQKRRQPENSAYLDLAIMRAAIDAFQAEGIEFVYMGIAPIAAIEPSGFDHELKWLRKSLEKAHESDWVNNRVFSTKGLAEYKNRFRGTPIPLYLGLPRQGANALRLLALLRLIRIF